MEEQIRKTERAALQNLLVRLLRLHEIALQSLDNRRALRLTARLFYIERKEYRQQTEFYPQDSAGDVERLLRTSCEAINRLARTRKIYDFRHYSQLLREQRELTERYLNGLTESSAEKAADAVRKSIDTVRKTADEAVRKAADTVRTDIQKIRDTLQKKI